MEALSGLIAMSIERAEALENTARSEAAKETERLRTALLDSVTHELRTPLTSIKASITSLLSQASLDEPSRDELLHVIDEESDRLNHLIEQAVEMAQLDAHKVQLELKPLDIGDLIKTAAEQMRSAYPGREFRVTLASTLPPVLADADWIQKVLGNLLGNAVKYSAAGQPVFVSADRQGDLLAISVADRGAGIDPLEQGMIFDKFYRGQSVRDPGRANESAVPAWVWPSPAPSSTPTAAPSPSPASSATAPSSPSPSPSPAPPKQICHSEP